MNDSVVRVPKHDAPALSTIPPGGAGLLVVRLRRGRRDPHRRNRHPPAYGRTLGLARQPEYTPQTLAGHDLPASVRLNRERAAALIAACDPLLCCRAPPMEAAKRPGWCRHV